MNDRIKNIAYNQYPYPREPAKWDREERRFSQGLKYLFDILFARPNTDKAIMNIVYPVGTIVLAANAPSSGTWEQVTLGLQDVTAWRRTA